MKSSDVKMKKKRENEKEEEEEDPKSEKITSLSMALLERREASFLAMKPEKCLARHRGGTRANISFMQNRFNVLSLSLSLSLSIGR